MTPQAALAELLARVGSANGAAVLVSAAELDQWPAASVAAMKAQRLIAKAKPASSAECPGCERECVMPVHVLADAGHEPVAFVVCDKRSDINRVEVDSRQLTQWQCGTGLVIGFVAACLGLRLSEQATDSAALWPIAVTKGDKRSQMLCLRAEGRLDLVAGNGALPLVDLIVFDSSRFELDGAMVRQLVDAATPADNRYTPSNAKREARKLDTQAMYAEWQKAYRALKKKRPNMSETWYSQQIARMDIAKGRDAGTIKKKMVL